MRQLTNYGLENQPGSGREPVAQKHAVLTQFAMQNNKLIKGEKMMIAQNEKAATDVYWEFLWNTLHVMGWNLRHSSFTDNETGHPRHLVRARKGETTLICSAPSIVTAITTLFEATRSSD